MEMCLVLKTENSQNLTRNSYRPITQLNSTSHPKVAITRKEAQCELMCIPDS